MSTKMNDAKNARDFRAAVVLRAMIVVALMSASAMTLAATGQADIATSGRVVVDDSYGEYGNLTSMGRDSGRENPEAANRDKRGTTAPLKTTVLRKPLSYSRLQNTALWQRRGWDSNP
jgi:hypothetical protein